MVWTWPGLWHTPYDSASTMVSLVGCVIIKMLTPTKHTQSPPLTLTPLNIVQSSSNPNTPPLFASQGALLEAGRLLASAPYLAMLRARPLAALLFAQPLLLAFWNHRASTFGDEIPESTQDARQLADWHVVATAAELAAGAAEALGAVGYIGGVDGGVAGGIEGGGHPACSYFVPAGPLAVLRHTSYVIRFLLSRKPRSQTVQPLLDAMAGLRVLLGGGLGDGMGWLRDDLGIVYRPGAQLQGLELPTPELRQIAEAVAADATAAEEEARSLRRAAGAAPAAGPGHASSATRAASATTTSAATRSLAARGLRVAALRLLDEPCARRGCGRVAAAGGGLTLGARASAGGAAAAAAGAGAANGAPAAAAAGQAFRRCSRCKAARYCSDSCQRRDWPVHRIGCVAPILVVAPTRVGGADAGGAGVDEDEDEEEGEIEIPIRRMGRDVAALRVVGGGETEEGTGKEGVGVAVDAGRVEDTGEEETLEEAWERMQASVRARRAERMAVQYDVEMTR